jgi:hypothetical protein
MRPRCGVLKRGVPKRSVKKRVSKKSKKEENDGGASLSLIIVLISKISSDFCFV